jgi:hypothetical protein
MGKYSQSTNSGVYPTAQQLDQSASYILTDYVRTFEIKLFQDWLPVGVRKHRCVYD